jgi:hypothetical protein
MRETFVVICASRYMSRELVFNGIWAWCVSSDNVARPLPDLAS